MFSHLPPRHQYGLLALAAVGLFGTAYVGAERMRTPLPMKIENGLVAEKAPLPIPANPVASAPTELIVDVSGAVRKPGIVRLKPGARIYEAIQLAGGAKNDADLDRLNLAAPAVDGSKIYVPLKAERPRVRPVPLRGSLPEPPGGLVTPEVSIEPLKVESPPKVAPLEVPAGSAPEPTPHRTAKKTEPAAPVNINSASLEELETLPGVGPATAQKILDYRQDHGRFNSIEEILAVPGIGPKKLERMRAWLRI